MIPKVSGTDERPGEEAVFKRFLGIIYEGALITDLAAAILEANARALGFFQYKADELWGKPISQVAPDLDAALLQTILGNLENQRFTNVECSCVRKDGSVFPAEIVVNRFQLAGRSRLCFFVRDITARKRAEQAERELAERDLAMAQEIQRVLLPAVFPQIEGVEIGGFNVPAQTLGGDYYDIFRVDADHWGFAIADVSGKGVSGALVMTMCRSVLRLQARGVLSPRQVLCGLNRVLQPDMQEGTFITMIYGVFHPASGRFTFCRCGHEPLLHYRAASRQIEPRQPRGMGLGLDSPARFEDSLVEERLALEKGDVLAFYTDGITEALHPDGGEFGLPRLCGLIAAGKGRTPSQMVAQVESELREFTGGQLLRDDMTLMILRT